MHLGAILMAYVFQNGLGQGIPKDETYNLWNKQLAFRHNIL